MTRERTAVDYIQDIREEITNISKFSEGMTFDEFKADTMRLYACIRSLEVIGEAAKNISEEFKKKHPKVPWRKMTGMRDILIHAYFGTDPKIIWKTITESIPELEEAIEKI